MGAGRNCAPCHQLILPGLFHPPSKIHQHKGGTSGSEFQHWFLVCYDRSTHCQGWNGSHDLIDVCISYQTTPAKKHFKLIHNSPLLHQMYWTFGELSNLWPTPIYMISLSHSPKPTSKIKLTQPSTSFSPPHIFSTKKSASKVAIVAITHCKDTSFSPGFTQRFVATRTKCHLVASSSNVFCITCSLYLLMNRVCHVYG